MKTLRRVPPPKTAQRKMSEYTIFIVNQIETRYKNGVIEKLIKKDVAKFHDKVGNFGSVIMMLSNQVKRKILRQFDNEAVTKQIRKILLGADKQNKNLVYNNIEQVIGISKQSLIAKDGLTPEINALIIDTENWIKKLRDDCLENFANNSLRVATYGGSLNDIVKELTKNASDRKNQGKFIARQQVSSFNSISTSLRHQKLGIIEAIWDTAMDGKERECHLARNGKVFKLKVGLYSPCDGKTIFTGIEYGCRCDFRSILPEALTA